MKTLKSKSYARIFVDTADNIARVRDIVKEINPHEYEYLPDDLIAPYIEHPTTVYTGKFDVKDIQQQTKK